MSSWSTPIWILVFAAGGLTELVALFTRRRGDTLSEHVWMLTRPGSGKPGIALWASRGAVALVCLWLAGHFAMGWWTL